MRGWSVPPKRRAAVAFAKTTSRPVIWSKEHGKHHPTTGSYKDKMQQVWGSKQIWRECGTRWQTHAEGQDDQSSMLL